MSALLDFLNNFFLFNDLEDMWCVHYDADRTGDGCAEEYVEEKSVDDRRHKLPVIAYLH